MDIFQQRIKIDRDYKIPVFLHKIKKDSRSIVYPVLNIKSDKGDKSDNFYNFISVTFFITMSKNC